MTLREFQDIIRDTYYERDNARGVEGTFLWLVEEVGELAEAIRCGNKESATAEFADVAAWLFTLATLMDIDMEEAVGKYSNGCPKCGSSPCVC